MKTLFPIIFVWAILTGHLSAQTVEAGGTGLLIFISDTQSPLWVEELFLTEHDNEIARSVLLNDIVQQKPTAVIHLGDLVSLGYDEEDWQTIDKFLTRLRRKSIPFFPVLGNHELLIFPGDGWHNFMRRFPAFVKSGYTKRFGNTAVILLNSNFSYMHDVLINKQQTWYENELSRLSMDPSIAHIIVGCHHPPYTNSSIVSASEEVQQRFVKPFVNNRKCRLFISGHAHRFEHFRFFGKDFIVAGGGGGLQHPARTGSEHLFADRFRGKGDLCPFHYVEIFPGKALKVVMRRFSGETYKTEEGYSFLIDQDHRNLVEGKSR